MVIILILIITGCSSKKEKGSSFESPENEGSDLPLPEKRTPRAFYGKLTEDKVRIRTAPSLNSDITGELTLGEEVQVLCRTSETYAIYGMNDYWYVIKRNNGVVGWTYGYYISFDEPVDNALYVHYVDYSDEVKYEDRSWVGEYYVYRLLNDHNLPPGYAKKLHKTNIRIDLQEAYELYIGFHPEIDEEKYVLLKTMNQMDGFIVDEFEPGKIEVSFVHSYVVVTGESVQEDQTYTYEIYYAKKKD